MRDMWYYLKDGIAIVGEFVCIAIGVAGALLGGAAIWQAHGWLAVPVALAWLVAWIAAASAIDEATS